MATVVAFIDARIGDPAAIVDRLPPDTDWYVLAADDDSIGEMRRILAGYSDLAAIHVVSHGGEGALYLGGTTLDADSLPAHAAALADVGSALSEDGDLLLYGCDVGRGDAGAAFVDALAGLTGADVAASSDATGSAALGGDWTLEVATGPIEAESLGGGDFAALLAAFVSITPQQAVRPEGATGPTLFTFALIRSGDVGAQQTVDWSVAGVGGQPADAVDFGGTLPSGTVTFAFGEVNKIVTVSVSGDSTVELDETFSVTLSNASGGLVIQNGTTGGTIQNDDTSTVSIAPSSATKAEGNGGTTAFTFTVSLDQAGVADQTIGWAVAGDGAHPADAADFGGALPSGTASFAAGETSKTVTVLVSGDAAIEFDESFVVKLSGPSAGLALGTTSATGTAQNDDKSVVSIAPLLADKAEGNGGATSFTFAVSLDQPSVADQTVSWSVTGSGTDPADGLDFGGTLPSGTATFAAGETSKILTVLVSGDLAFECDEDFTLTLSNASAGLSILNGSASGTIQNDDTTTVSITALSAAKPEGNGDTTAFTFRVEALDPGCDDKVLSYSLSGSGAHAADAADFGGTLPTGTVTFAAGETSKTITVEAVGDSLTEADESFTVTLSDPSPGLTLGNASAVGTILNDDVTISIGAADAVKPEGTGGSTTFTYSVTLPAWPADKLDYGTIAWSVTGSGDRAAAASDFAGGMLPAGTLTFAPGETSKTIMVEVAGDSLVEDSESFTVTLSDPSPGVTLSNASAMGTILNDDVTVLIAAVDAVKPEGNMDTAAFTFDVSWSGPGDEGPEESITFVFGTIAWSVTGSGGYAATASDFAGGVLPGGTVTFSPGETSKTITVEAAGDSLVESDESFTVTLSNPSPGLTLGNTSAEGTILNDDATVSIAVTDATRAEGNNATTSFTFTVTVTTDLGDTSTHEVGWWMAGIGPHPADASDFVDSVLPSGTLTFAAGETSKTITVEVAGDTVLEADETFQVTLSNPSPGLTLGNASAVGTILNDDVAPPDVDILVSIAPADAVKPEGNGGSTIFTYYATAPIVWPSDEQWYSIAWSVTGSGDRAATASDFASGVLPAGTVTFTPGETSKTIMVEVAGEALVEPDETFNVSLSNPSPGLTLGAASAEGTILNDDATVSIAAVSTTEAEGNSGATAFVLKVRMEEEEASHDVVSGSVQWSVAGAGANPAAAVDFLGGVLPSGTLTFAPGETVGTIMVQAVGDSLVEADEGFTVTLSNPSPGLTLGTASAGGTILNDDATVSIAAIDATKAEGDDGVTFIAASIDLDDFISTRTAQFSLSWQVTGTGPDPADASDFAGGVLPSGTVTFAPGETSKTITVEVAGDTVVEPDESYKVTLSDPSPGLTLCTAGAEGTILDDDTAFSIAAADAVKPEGNTAATAFTFTVSSSESATICWTVTGSAGHAADASDFAGGVLPTGMVTFAPGETSKTITVEVVGDTVVEADENFTVTLCDPLTGLALGNASAGGTILNDDATVSIATIGATKVEGDDGVTVFAHVIDLDDFISTRTTQFSLSWQVAGTGSDPADASDFAGGVLPSGVVTFAPGETSKTITVEVAGDTMVEPDEGFTVTLSNPSPGLVIGTASATATILDDDKSTVSIAALGTPTCVDGDNDSYVDTCYMIVSLDQAPVIMQTVHWSTIGSGPSPAQASDFAGGVLPSGTLTYAPGETSKTIALAIEHDTLVEPDEGFTVSLSGPSSRLVLGVTAASGTILNDDLHAHDDAYVVLEGRPLTVALDSGILINDEAIPPVTASALTNPIHGLFSRLMEEEGIFYYTLPAGFTGIDSFTYRASGGAGGHDEGEVRIHVVPVSVGATTTLDLLRLTPEEQIAATYAAFFGRAADAAGHAFWVGQFNAGLPVQGAATLFANIASSFGISDEAKALYPFLANPFGASDSQIGAFLDSVYNNLFDRSSDALGLAYWTNQIRQTLQAGQFVGSVLVNIMSGAQDTAAGLDITTLMSKVAVGLHFVEEQNLFGVPWTDGDVAAATALLGDVTSDPRSVLVGIEHADFAAWSMDVRFEGQNAA